MMISSTFAIVLQGLLGLCLVAYAVYACITVWAARQWSRARFAINPDWTPRVTILKPVCGLDEDLYENCLSHCLQEYPTQNFQLVFGALDPNDPALTVARRLQAEFPALDIQVVCGDGTPPPGTNFKVCNLINMLPSARHDLLVLSDSDIRVDPDYLRRVVAPFEPGVSESEVGLVTCPYRAEKAQGFSASLEALGIGADFIPGTLVGRALEGVTFGLGQTIVLPRAVLEQLGGFESLREELADDYRLGNGVYRLGYQAILSDYMLLDVLGRQSFRTMWARRLRWARTIRVLRPTGYAGTLITHGTALALLLLGATGFSPLGGTVFAATPAIRLTTAVWIAERYTHDRNVLRLLPLLPFSDLFSFALFVVSYCGSGILWRGEQFRLLPDGRLTRFSTEGRPASH